MSSFWYHYGRGELIKDSIGIVDGEFIDGVPFIKSISTVLHRRNGTSCDYVLPITMPGYLGSAGHLLVVPGYRSTRTGSFASRRSTGPRRSGTSWEYRIGETVRERARARALARPGRRTSSSRSS